MNVHVIGWLLLLTVIKNFGYSVQEILFTLLDTNVTAQEGSCAEIKCEVSSKIEVSNSYHFWMKNPHYDNAQKRFDATIIYSTNSLERPVSPDYETRVKYIGAPSEKWRDTPYSLKYCSILICDLNNNDSANYSFRYVGSEPNNKWATENVILTVTKNPCLITFMNPPAVKEFDQINLICSTSTSCPSYPQIEGLTKKSQHTNNKPDEKQKTTTVEFTATSEDDGKVFSCQTSDNKDTYLIRNITLSVQYAPKDVSATVNSTDIKEGQTVMLTCSAKAHPNATFTWFQNDEQKHYEMVWVIQSITESQSGNYKCVAHNIVGNNQSNSVLVDVTYAPQVELKKISHDSDYHVGQNMTLKCVVIRSNPHPHLYSWFKSGTELGVNGDTYSKVLEPADNGQYHCRATNIVGTGSSQPHQINVLYGPMNTRISSEWNEKAKVDKRFTFFCHTEANPTPLRYYWYRFNKTKDADSTQWSSRTTETNQLILERVQRTDEACYFCNTTNSVGIGKSSDHLCIQVLYPPTKVVLSMAGEVKEGQHTTITCTADSYPRASLLITLSPQSSKSPHFPRSTQYSPLNYTFNVNSADTGFYTCQASNSEGKASSEERKLVVKYRPKNVTVIPVPGLTVQENKSLTLQCNVQSHPEVTSVTWTKDGKTKTMNRTLTIQSVNPADSGLYRCSATNEIGTGDSQSAHVKVTYAPKHTKITTVAEQQHPDNTLSVTLNCRSNSFPEAKKYSWYRKRNAEENYAQVSKTQHYTVRSDQPGTYYCIAENGMGGKRSDPINLFLEGGFKKVLKFSLPFLIVLLVIVFIVFVCRHRRNKSIQRGTGGTPICSLGWWNWKRSRTRINQSIVAEPFRNGDDQPHHPNGQRQQSRPDSTPASNINSVYCTVNLPARTQGPPAQNPVRQQDGGAAEESLHYAALNFGNKQKDKKAEENIVYAMVFKQNPPNKVGQENLEDYENISAAQTARTPNPENYDSDTSEEDVEINYSQVSFKAKPGYQWASSDSSTSDDEDIQYSDIKI